MSKTGGLRVAILDDAPYVAWRGRHYARNATFHVFASALLDVRDVNGRAAIGQLVLAAPVRATDRDPATLAVDPRIQVLPTLPFEGIAGYLRRAPLLAARNLPRLRRAFAGVDVVVLRLPASNGLPAAMLAVAMGRPRVSYIVGSVAAVARAQERAPGTAIAARTVGIAYDVATHLAGVGSQRVVVGRLTSGAGIISSLVLPTEIRSPAARPSPPPGGTLRLVYAGRLVEDKGVPELLEAVARLAADPLPGTAGVELDLVGDGPARADLEREAVRLGIAGQVVFSGYVAGREPYLERLARADMFVTGSAAEGFPKAVLDAMAVGLPVVAVPAGFLASLASPDATLDGSVISAIPARDPVAMAATIRRLQADPHERARLQAAGHAFVCTHTMPAEAGRLVGVLERAAGRGGR